MAENNQKRVIIVVNKYWECDPVCWVLTNKYIKDNEQCSIDLNVVNTIKLITYPSYGPVKVINPEDSNPRIIFETVSTIFEIWCISDILSNSDEIKQSSSEEKMRLMPIIFNYKYNNLDREIKLVIALGTASSGPSLKNFGEANINGSIVIGSQVFMHNGWDTSSKSNFQCDCWSQILQSGNTDFIKTLKEEELSKYESLLLSPFTNPSPSGQHFYVDENYIALGDVNVTDYSKYTIKDEETGEDFFTHYHKNTDGLSLETTHCLIYLTAKKYLGNKNPPFIFISGIVDRYTKFSIDVSPKVYEQNVSGAHNAGVAAAYVISKLMS